MKMGLLPNLARATCRTGRACRTSERRRRRGRRAGPCHSLAVVVDHLGSPLQAPVPHEVVGAGAGEVAQVELDLPHPVQRVQRLHVDTGQLVADHAELGQVGQAVESAGQHCNSVVAQVKLVEAAAGLNIVRTKSLDRVVSCGYLRQVGKLRTSATYLASPGQLVPVDRLCWLKRWRQ